MGKQGSPPAASLEVTDSLGRKWPLQKALKAMDPKLRRRLGLAFDHDVAQFSFEAYCKKHFIEHGKHFDPGESKITKTVIAKQAQPALKLITPTFDPQFVAAKFESDMRQIAQGMDALKSNMKNLDVETLREITQVMSKVLNVYKDIERLELQYMNESEFEAVLEGEVEANGVRAGLSLGKYFLEYGLLTESKQVAVARWLSECAQDEFDRVLAAICQTHGIRMKVKVELTGLDWSSASLQVEDDRRWIPLTRKPFDFNVIIGMVLGVLAGKGMSTQSVASECASLLFPLETVGVSQGVVAMAINKMKTKTTKSQLLLGHK
jgi:hypothetical protein